MGPIVILFLRVQKRSLLVSVFEQNIPKIETKRPLLQGIKCPKFQQNQRNILSSPYHPHPHPITKEFLLILIWVHFTKKSLGFFFTWKSFVKIFPIFKLESDFFPHFLSKIRKLENCENLSILSFKCAKFQRNRRQKNSHFHFTHFTHSLTSHD